MASHIHVNTHVHTHTPSPATSGRGHGSVVGCSPNPPSPVSSKRSVEECEASHTRQTHTHPRKNLGSTTMNPEYEGCVAITYMYTVTHSFIVVPPSSLALHGGTT